MQPYTGRTLAIKQMLLEEQLAKIQQGIDQAGPYSPIGRIMTVRQAELESEIAQVHEERNEAIRSLLSEEMSRSAANPGMTGRPVVAPTQRRGMREGQSQRPPFAPAGSTSVAGMIPATAGGRAQTRLSDHDLAAIARILRNPQPDSQDGNATERSQGEQPSAIGQAATFTQADSTRARGTQSAALQEERKRVANSLATTISETAISRNWGNDSGDLMSRSKARSQAESKRFKMSFR